MSRKRVGLIALFSFTSLLALTCALGALTSYAYESKVLPRTMIAGVSVGNLTYAEASQKIAEQGSELGNIKVTFSLNDQSANVALSDMGVAVDTQSALAQVIRPANPFDWLSPGYWKAMFSNKSVGYSYKADTGAVRKKVETSLGVKTAAEDATISYENGQLVVREAKSGLSISDADIDTAIKAALAFGQPVQATLSFSQSPPSVTTEAAQATVSEIEQTLQPVSLQFESQTFTITPASQKSFLTFTPNNSRISYSVSSDKLRSYLASTVARKVNIIMLPKTTQFDTQQVTQEGRDGREIDSVKLAQAITQTITEDSNAARSPIIIATRTIPFTEKIIYPGYVAGLFPGLYVDINLAKQRMYIMNGTTLQSEFLISSGKPGTPSPQGLLYTCNKIELARSPLYVSLYMPVWNALSTSPTSCAGYRGFGIHDLPCWNSSCTLVEGEDHLGRPVSHGCIRLGHENARWFYSNVPIGTPVNIHT